MTSFTLYERITVIICSTKKQRKGIAAFTLLILILNLYYVSSLSASVMHAFIYVCVTRWRNMHISS